MKERKPVKKSIHKRSLMKFVRKFWLSVREKAIKAFSLRAKNRRFRIINTKIQNPAQSLRLSTSRLFSADISNSIANTFNNCEYFYAKLTLTKMK